jgi:hypothetical protein
MVMGFPRKVNRILGSVPSIGPIPGDMLMYFVGSVMVGLLLQSWLALDWPTTVFTSFGAFVASYLCIGRKEWKFFSQLMKTPRLVRIVPPYLRLLKKQQRAKRSSRTRRSSHSRTS